MMLAAKSRLSTANSSSSISTNAHATWPSRLFHCSFSYRMLVAYALVLVYIYIHYFVSFKHHNRSNVTAAKRHPHHMEPMMRHLLVDDDDNNDDNNDDDDEKKRHFRKRSVDIDMRQRSTSSILNTLLNRNGKRAQRILVERHDAVKLDYTYDNSTRAPTSSINDYHYYSQIRQDRILLHLLNTFYFDEREASQSGLFVEAGAYDGESWSNTLHLERQRGWTGLLIEPSVENYDKLVGKRRNAYSTNSCLSAGASTTQLTYIEAGPFGITTNTSTSPSATSTSTSSSTSVYEVTCYPLATILDQFFQQLPSSRAARPSRISGTTHTIDYMSLDIEGNERAVLTSFPWHSHRFNFLNIEYNQDKKKYVWLIEFMRKHGYRETFVDDVWYQDVYLAHESIFDKLNRNVSFLVSNFV